MLLAVDVHAPHNCGRTFQPRNLDDWYTTLMSNQVMGCICHRKNVFKFGNPFSIGSFAAGAFLNQAGIFARDASD